MVPPARFMVWRLLLQPHHFRSAYFNLCFQLVCSRVDFPYLAIAEVQCFWLITRLQNDRFLQFLSYIARSLRRWVEGYFLFISFS